MAPVYEVPLADMPPKVINLTFRHQSSFFLGFVVTSILKDDIPEDYDYSHFEYINKVIKSKFWFCSSSGSSILTFVHFHFQHCSFDIEQSTKIVH